MIVCGVDPGLGGALALLDVSSGDIEVVDLPTFALRRGKSVRRDLDGHALRQLIAARCPGHAWIEQAQAMPGQSAYATGIFFQIYGEIRGLLIASGVPLTVVHPRTWKRALGVPREKDGARARASQLLPAHAHLWPLKKHDGRAEAALIATYGVRTFAAIAVSTEEEAEVSKPTSNTAVGPTSATTYHELQREQEALRQRTPGFAATPALRPGEVPRIPGYAWNADRSPVPPLGEDDDG